MDGQTDTLELTAIAEFKGDEKDYYITYYDNEGDLRDCITTLHVENGSFITISRKGDNALYMVIEKNVRHISQHSIPEGSFSMGVSASVVESNMTPDGGTLRFKYTTDIEMHPLTEIEMDIEIRRR